jgi:hypothetical protein
MISQETKDKFIAKLESTGLIAHACKATGLSRASVYRWLKEDKGFAKQVEVASEIGRDDWSDLSESKLLEAVRRGEPWAIRYWLEFNSPRYYKPRKAKQAPVIQRSVKTINYNIVDARPKKDEPL